MEVDDLSKRDADEGDDSDDFFAWSDDDIIDVDDDENPIEKERRRFEIPPPNRRHDDPRYMWIADMFLDTVLDQENEMRIIHNILASEVVEEVSVTPLEDQKAFVHMKLGPKSVERMNHVEYPDKVPIMSFKKILVINVVMTLHLIGDYTVSKLVQRIPTLDRNDKFSAAVVRLKDKVTILVFDDRHCVITGASEESMGYPAAQHLIRLMRNVGFDVSVDRIVLSNMVGTWKTDLPINLHDYTKAFGYVYDGRRFPGAHVKDGEKEVLNVFRRSVIITGGKSRRSMTRVGYMHQVRIRQHLDKQLPNVVQSTDYFKIREEEQRNRVVVQQSSRVARAIVQNTVERQNIEILAAIAGTRFEADAPRALREASQSPEAFAALEYFQSE